MIPTPCTLVGASAINYINHEKIELWHNYGFITFIISSAFNISCHIKIYSRSLITVLIICIPELALHCMQVLNRFFCHIVPYNNPTPPFPCPSEQRPHSPLSMSLRAALSITNDHQDTSNL